MPRMLRLLKIFNFYPDSGLPFCGIWPNILPVCACVCVFYIKELPCGLVLCFMVLAYYLAQLFLIFQNDSDIAVAAFHRPDYMDWSTLLVQDGKQPLCLSHVSPLQLFKGCFVSSLFIYTALKLLVDSEKSLFSEQISMLLVFWVCHWLWKGYYRCHYIIRRPWC